MFNSNPITIKCLPLIGRLWTSFLCLGGALLALIPASPLVQKLTSGDSGIFLYVGWRITESFLPYRDAWDSKPPLIFAVNALGLMLGNGSRWGVWTIEVLSMFVALLMAFYLVNRALGLWSAIYATIALLINAFLAMDGGNYTTEYGLPLQIGCLLVVATAPLGGVLSMRRAFVIGTLGALLFWLKQNLIGIPLAIGLYLTISLIAGKQKTAYATALIAMGAGALLISLIVLLPFASHDLLEEVWDAAFRYNFSYIATTWIKRIVVLRYVPIALPAAGFVLFAFAGYLLTCTVIVQVVRRKQEIESQLGSLFATLSATPANISPPQVTFLFGVLLIALPLELVLVSLPGYSFDHYFLALLPACMVFAALSVRVILYGLEQLKISSPATAVFMLLFLGVIVVFSSDYFRVQYSKLSGRQESLVAKYLVQNTQPSDLVVIWGGQARVLFAARRRSPTRFFTFLPLAREAANVHRVEEFLESLLQNPPAVMIDIHRGPPFLQFLVTSPAIDEMEHQLREKYHEYDTIEGWTIYKQDSP